jgi:hypothetical protein
MGVQPIDLQNMYSQLSNVAKTVAGQHQAAQLSESMQQQNQIEKNLQEAQKIQQTNEKSNTGNVNENGHHGSMYYGQQKKKQENEPDENQQHNSSNSKESSYIGTIIDITR